MPKILVTRRIPQPALDLLQTAFDEVVLHPHDRNISKAEILAQIPDCDALLCMLTNPVDREVLDAGVRLKVVSNYAVGYNNIDVDYATQKHIAVCNTPGVLTETTADLTWSLIMAACRRLVEGDKMMREQRFPGWEPMLLLGVDIYGKTLGIIGLGRIGEAVARRAAGFNMRILYYEVTGPRSDLTIIAEYVDLPTLFTEADIITLHTPLTTQTHHLIDESAFALMKPSAVVVNTARGPIIDETALVKALRERRIFAAGLDVYEHEPALAPGLADLPNVVLAPHIGSASIETRTRMALLAAQNAIAVIRGETPPASVNRY